MDGCVHTLFILNILLDFSTLLLNLTLIDGRVAQLGISSMAYGLPGNRRDDASCIQQL